jgi:hypothetical protein
MRIGHNPITPRTCARRGCTTALDLLRRHCCCAVSRFGRLHRAPGGGKHRLLLALLPLLALL